jgi:integrase
MIRRHLTPLIGRRPVRELSAEEIRAALLEVARGSVPTAEAVRLRLARLLDEAVADGHRPDNPARTETARPPKRRPVTTEGDARNVRVLNDLPRFLAELETSGRRPALLLYVRFTLLTLRNPKECRLATWPQIDLDGQVWRFPKMQSEGAPEVVVPLHRGILEVLERARSLGRGDRTGWVFPNPLDLNAPYSMHAAQHVPEEFGFGIKMRDFVRVHAYWSEREPESAAGGLSAWHQRLREAEPEADPA